IVLAITLTMIVEPRNVAPALALAYGASYLVGALISLTMLSHRIGGLQKVDLLEFVGRVMGAAVPAALLAAITLGLLEASGLHVGSKADSLVLLTVGAVVGLLVYILVARLLRIDEIRQVVSVVTRRGRSGARPAA